MLSTIKKIIGLIVGQGYQLLRWLRLYECQPLYGVKCLIHYGEYVLFVRHTYGPREWTFPGGKIKSGEDPLEAAIREVEEEVGLSVAPIMIKKFTEGERPLWPAGSQVYSCSAPASSKEFKIDEIEIAEARWLNINNLPKISPFAKMIVGEWQSRQRLPGGR